jgi:hypothetical protein
MKKLFCVIVDCGDGSNSFEWYSKSEIIDKIQELADKGEERYASGDGLQVREFVFPDDFDVEKWAEVNHLYLDEDRDFEDDE